VRVDSLVSNTRETRVAYRMAQNEFHKETEELLSLE